MSNPLFCLNCLAFLQSAQAKGFKFYFPHGLKTRGDLFLFENTLSDLANSLNA